MAESPVFSRRAAERFQPDGWERAYDLAPLTFLERQAYRADLARMAGAMPSDDQMMAAIRATIREVAPANAAELLAVVQAFEETPDDADARARVAAVEAAMSTVPVYAGLAAAREHYVGVLPFVAARHALRGWSGPGLPDFRRERGLVPDALLDAIPDSEITALGWRAHALTTPGRGAEKNSEAPSPSPTTPETSPAA